MPEEIQARWSYPEHRYPRGQSQGVGIYLVRLELSRSWNQAILPPYIRPRPQKERHLCPRYDHSREFVRGKILPEIGKSSSSAYAEAHSRILSLTDEDAHEDAQPWPCETTRSRVALWAGQHTAVRREEKKKIFNMIIMHLFYSLAYMNYFKTIIDLIILSFICFIQV